MSTQQDGPTARQTTKELRETGNEGYKPAVPDMVRTVVYAATLIWGFLATFVVGAAAVFWPEHAREVLVVIGSGSTAFSWLAGALGVAYRPTRTQPTPAP